MKKILTLCTAILLAAAFTSCGKSSEDKPSSAPTNAPTENSDTEKTDEDEQIVVDPFENVKYTIPTLSAGTNHVNVYPDDFEIKFDFSETPFYDRINFDYEVLNAGTKDLTIKVTADIHYISDFLAETAYEVEKTEAIYKFDISELTANLLNADQITEENKAILIEAMQNCIDSYFDDDPNIEFTIKKLGVVFPKEDTQFSTSIYSSMDSISVSSAKTKNAGAVFIDNNGNYYALESGQLIFKEGKLDTENLKISVRQYYDKDHMENGFTYEFPDENSAFLSAISYARGGEIENGSILEEIPLK